MAAVSPDSPVYQRMMPILRDMEAFTRDEYSMYAPLPEDVLQAERQAKQAAKEAKRKAPTPQRTTSEDPPASGDRLAAAARALAKKRPTAAQEDQDGQFNLFSAAAPVPLEPEPPAPIPEAQPVAPPQAPEQAPPSTANPFSAYNAIKEAHPDSIVLYQVGDFFEMYGEDARTAAPLLELNLSTRAIPDVGRVDFCGIPAHALDQTVEKLRASHDVTLAPFDETARERQTYTMLSFDKIPPGTEDIKTTVTVPNYEATVIDAEAPWLARLLQSHGINATQFVHDNGDVTFSFAAADKDAVEKLISKLRATINKAVAESYNHTKAPKPGRTKVELNYRNFAKMFPEIASGEYRYFSMEAGEGMMPLHLEWIDTDVIAVSHTYVQNGDLMRDPEMTFRVDREKGTLEPLTFQQDGSIQLSEPIPFVREFGEEVQQSEEYIAAEMAEQFRKDEAAEKAAAENSPAHGAADEIPLGMELTVEGQRVKIDSVDVEHDIVRLKILDSAYSYLQRSIQAVRDLIAKARAAVRGVADSVQPPEPEQVEIDGGQIVTPSAPAPRQPRRERHNFQITDNNLGVGGEKTKYQYNVAAIRTLKQIEAEGRLATPEEQEILSRYVGWGGIAGAFDEKDPKWAKEYAELKELLTPEEYKSLSTN